MKKAINKNYIDWLDDRKMTKNESRGEEGDDALMGEVKANDGPGTSGCTTRDDGQAVWSP